MPDPRATVATVLAVGLVLVLLSGTSLRHIWSPVSAANPSPDLITVWKDIILVIIGVLAGYISGANTK
jgi:hypothetical protein